MPIVRQITSFTPRVLGDSWTRAADARLKARAKATRRLFARSGRITIPHGTESRKNGERDSGAYARDDAISRNYRRVTLTSALTSGGGDLIFCGNQIPTAINDCPDIADDNYPRVEWNRSCRCEGYKECIHCIISCESHHDTYIYVHMYACVI